MAIHVRAAMTRHVFDHRSDAARKQSLGNRPAHRSDAFRLTGERPRPDRGVRSGLGDIEHRRAIDSDSDFPEIMGNEASDKPRCGLAASDSEACLDCGCGGVGAPVRAAPSAEPARPPDRS